MLITAENLEEFKKIEGLIAKLQKEVSEQIISASFNSSGWLDCELEKKTQVQGYYIPSGFRFIVNKEEIRIICSDIRFIIPIKNFDKDIILDIV